MGTLGVDVIDYGICKNFLKFLQIPQSKNILVIKNIPVIKVKIKFITNNFQNMI